MKIKMILLSGLVMGQTTLPMTRMAKHATVGARACLVHKLPTRLVASRLIGAAPGVARSLGVNPYKSNLCTQMALVVAAGFTFNEIARCDNQANQDLHDAIARYDMVGIIRALVNGAEDPSDEDLQRFKDRLNVMLESMSYNDVLESATIFLDYANGIKLENMESDNRVALLLGLRLAEVVLKENIRNSDDLALQQLENEYGLKSVKQMKRLYLQVQQLLVAVKKESSWEERISSDLIRKMMLSSSQAKKVSGPSVLAAKGDLLNGEYWGYWGKSGGYQRARKTV